MAETEEIDPGLAALQRVLAQGSSGGQSLSDAMVALCGREVFVPTWGPPQDEFRRLQSSDGASALPIFSSRPHLDEAATRFGWKSPDGQLAQTQVPATKALQFALDAGCNYVVVDITADHSLEIDTEAIGPALSQAADAGPVASTIETTPREAAPAASAGAAPAAAESSVAPIVPQTGEFTISRGGLDFAPLETPPDDELLAALSEALKPYPEVEWAAYCHIAGDAGAQPTVGLRVDSSFRTRMEEIAGKVRTNAHTKKVNITVVVMDGPELAKLVREKGLPFYPWRRKTMNPF